MKRPPPFLALTVITLALLPQQTTPDPHHYPLKPTAPPGARRIDLALWQALLPPDTPLSALSIPGTHDTMAYPRPPATTSSTGGKEKKSGRRGWLPPTVQTQQNDLATQLRKGVRYIDLRLQHVHDRFTCHHGRVYLHCDFAEVLSILEHFFSRQGGDRETVLVRIMCANCYFSGRGAGGVGENGNTRTFEQTMRWYRHANPLTHDFFRRRVYAGTGIPNLGQARGKIVVLQGFSSDALMYLFPLPSFVLFLFIKEGRFGIFWGDPGTVRIQDAWSVAGQRQAFDKVRLIRDFFDSLPAAAATTSATVPPLAVNHLSGSGGPLWGPRAVSNIVYARLYQWMKWEWDAGRPMGVVVGDYMTEAITRVIVEKNFLPGGAGQALAGTVDFCWEYWHRGFQQEERGDVRIVAAHRRVPPPTVG